MVFVIDILKEIYFLFIEMAPYLLIGLIFVGLLNLWMTKDIVVKYIGKRNFWSVLKSSLFGIPLPLCSCGVVPTAVYMSKNGASKPSVVSFLISTPQTGIDSIIATYGMMGWVFAIFRPIAALFMGVVSGTLLNFIEKNKNHQSQIDFSEYETPNDNCDDSCDLDCDSDDNYEKENKFKKFFNYSFVEFLDDISVQFVIGLIISGLIAYFIPENYFGESSVNNGILGMLLMIAVGVPMYICATASIPIAVTLMMKGFSPGVAFVFLAVGPATNAASLTIIANVLGKKITIMYVTFIAITAIISGYILDAIFKLFKINQSNILSHIHEHGGLISQEIKWILGAVFAIMLIASLYRKLILSKKKSKEQSMDSTKIKIEGMSCNHCVMNVKKAINDVSGVHDVNVNLEQGEAYIKGDFDLNTVEKSITDIGYQVIK